MGRYAFLKSPKWIFGHVIVLVLVVGFINAGLWQLHRLDERKAFNAQVEANMAQPVVPIGTVLPPESDFADATQVLNRQVSATGHYLIDQEFVITGQANAQSRPGVWAVTPLQLDDGRILLVNRGWLPSSGAITKPMADAQPPTGTVVVRGLVSETQTEGAGQAKERSTKDATNFLRIDISRIQNQFAAPLVPAFLLREHQRPADPGPQVPVPLARPELDNGPHLSYALQWFGFTLIALVSYPILVRTVARDREKKRRADDEPIDLPPGAFIDDDGVIDLTAVKPDH